MERIVIDGKSVRITRRQGDLRVDLELASGQRFEKLEARRMFPISDPEHWVTLLDEEKREVAVIPRLDQLEAEDAAAVLDSLKEYYLIPQILSVLKVENRPGGCTVQAQTDHGLCTFKVENRQQDIKRLPDGRILIRDANDNRYEILDCGRLDRKSRDGLQL